MKFSIAIPTYKIEFLKSCINSCLNQSYKDFEIIIVNDHSPYDVDSIVSMYNDDRIRYYVNDTNCGAENVVDNWNKCLSYATGDYIICMGDDDELCPNCLRDYFDIINAYPGLGVYHILTEVIDERGDTVDVQIPRPQFESVYSLIYFRMTCRFRQYIGDFLFEVNSLRNEGGFYKLPFAWGSDDISSIRSASYLGIANVSTIGFRYRDNSMTISRSEASSGKMMALLKEKRWIEAFLETVPDDVTDRKLYDLICKKLELFYLTKKKNLFYDCLNSKGFVSIFDWINNRKDYQLSLRNILRFLYDYLTRK